MNRVRNYQAQAESAARMRDGFEALMSSYETDPFGDYEMTADDLPGLMEALRAGDES